MLITEMGCNCKRKNQVINNLKSKDHLKIAYDVYMDIIQGKEDKYDMDNIDLLQLYPVYYQLYPNSSVKPTTTDLVDRIIDGYNRYNNMKK
jgi:hypothetical protein